MRNAPLDILPVKYYDGIRFAGDTSSIKSAAYPRTVQVLLRRMP